MKISKIMYSICAALCFSIVASQCFAQSQTSSANIDEMKKLKYLEAINTIYYYIQKHYVDEVDAQKLYEGALRGMFEVLDDPHSVYMDQSQWRNLNDNITVGSFGGVGLTITKPAISTDDKPAYVEVVYPIDDTPGARAGIQGGDLIIRIDDVDTAKITMDEVLGLLRGQVDTSVKVVFKRKNVEFERTLVRALIETPTVKYGTIDDVGYIRVIDFSQNTAKRFTEALSSFEGQKLKGIIIDLRNNGGGLLTSAVELCDKFISEGVIVSTRSRVAYENSAHYATKKATTVEDTPIVILTNRGSASASEIFTGALKDYKLAYVVGDRTFGKGSVQVPNALVANDGFKLTIGRYYTPSGENVDKVGIRPDLEVQFPEITPEEEEAWKQLEEADCIIPYVADHPQMSEQQISDYADSLAEKYKVEKRVLRKLIRNEVNKNSPSELYDLDFDIQLNAALNVIRTTKDFKALLAETKTVKEQKAELPEEEKQEKQE